MWFLLKLSNVSVDAKEFNACRLTAAVWRASVLYFSLEYETLSRMQKASRDAIVAAQNEGLLGTTVEMARAHLALYPTDERVWLILGRALGELSRFAEAEAAFERASSQENLRKFVYTARGHMEQRRGNYLEAERWFSEAIVAHPEPTYVHVFRAVVTGRRGDLKLAEQRYREAIAVCRAEDDDALDEIYANLGGVLVAQERYDEAAECFERALEIDPDYEFAKIRLKDVRKLLKLRPSK